MFPLQAKPLPKRVTKTALAKLPETDAGESTDRSPTV